MLEHLRAFDVDICKKCTLSRSGICEPNHGQGISDERFDFLPIDRQESLAPWRRIGDGTWGEQCGCPRRVLL